MSSSVKIVKGWADGDTQTVELPNGRQYRCYMSDGSFQWREIIRREDRAPSRTSVELDAVNHVIAEMAYNAWRGLTDTHEKEYSALLADAAMLSDYVLRYVTPEDDEDMAMAALANRLCGMMTKKTA